MTKLRLASHMLCVALMVATLLMSAANAADASKTKPALEGNCAVCLVNAGKLVKGNEKFSSTYDGQTYLFPSAKEQQVFDANPEQFAPVLNGDCVVCVVKGNVRMAGSTKHFARHEGRLYLFPASEQKTMFEKNPQEFVNADLAIGGNCSVCLTMAGKEVPGKAEFAARRDGWRYLFPSDKERQAFVKSPEKFAVSSKGQTDCAACTFKVHPIGSPDELGLAVKIDDKHILVVEDAHKLYADLYGKRFENLTVSVVGTPIKTDGKFTWIRPTFVSVAK